MHTRPRNGQGVKTESGMANDLGALFEAIGARFECWAPEPPARIDDGPHALAREVRGGSCRLSRAGRRLLSGASARRLRRLPSRVRRARVRRRRQHPGVPAMRWPHVSDRRRRVPARVRHLTCRSTSRRRASDARPTSWRRSTGVGHCVVGSCRLRGPASSIEPTSPARAALRIGDTWSVSRGDELAGSPEESAERKDPSPGGVRPFES